MALLEIDTLNVEYETDQGMVRAVDDATVSVEPDQTVGIIGESGCGKSTLLKSILKILDSNGKIESGEIRFNGEDITKYSERKLNKTIRWSEISMIPQNSMNAFNPVYTVGDQIVEAIRTHEDISKEKARTRTKELLDRVGIDGERENEYPHQFSGGMLQRVAIAMALSSNPSLILADEPTTALDVITQKKILDLLKDIQEQHHSAILLITHDMSVISEMSHEISVMYGGRIVESGTAEQIINHPQHPYTLGLRNAFPDITTESQDLISIPGEPPLTYGDLDECGFAPRCPFEIEQCTATQPPLEETATTKVACHRWEDEELQHRSGERETWMSIEGD